MHFTGTFGYWKIQCFGLINLSFLFSSPLTHALIFYSHLINHCNPTIFTVIAVLIPLFRLPVALVFNWHHHTLFLILITHFLNLLAFCLRMYSLSFLLMTIQIITLLYQVSSISFYLTTFEVFLLRVRITHI